MLEDIISLLRLFQGRVPDEETHAWMLAFVSDQAKWSSAHNLFDQIRRRKLAAIKASDRIRECQYCFEEVCVKTLYNETGRSAPFDYDSPYWIAKNAIKLARAIGVPTDAVVNIISPAVSHNATNP